MSRRALVFAIALVAGFDDAAAAALEVTVVDQDGRPVPDAVVLLRAPAAAPPTAPVPGIIDQIDKRFVPAVSAVPVGTSMSFPNRDDIKHHVYSFSPPKVFELKLYHGVPAAPVVFDRPGLVTLGCNIHDGMVAYLYVVDAATFALTDARGSVRFADGTETASVEAWHHQMDGEPVRATVAPGHPEGSLTLVLPLLAAAVLPPPLE
ncbi:MAG: methylamine utilization protein [Gammaproteobacteria bacterium]